MLNFYVERIENNGYHFIQITATGTLNIPTEPLALSKLNRNPLPLPPKRNATLTFEGLFLNRPGNLKVLGSFYNPAPTPSGTSYLKVTHFEIGNTQNYSPLFVGTKDIQFTTQAIVPGNPPKLVNGGMVGSVQLYLDESDQGDVQLQNDFFLSLSALDGNVRYGTLDYSPYISPVGAWHIL